MAGKSQHTEQTRALVYHGLLANDGNVKRTSRETGVHENTVRRWKGEWENGGRVPDPGVLEAVTATVVSELERTRNLALEKLHAAVDDGSIKGRDLVTAFGVLDDKLTRAKGLATNRTEHVVALPSADEVKAALLGLVAGAQQAAALRHAEIAGSNIVEQPRQLPR